MSLQGQRLIRDASLARTKSFARPGEETFCDSMVTDAGVVFFPIDIGEATFRAENFIASLEISAAPSLADGQTIQFTLQSSADEQGPFADTWPTISATVTGAGGNGSPRRSITFGLPSPIERYLIIKMECSAGDGDPSGDGSIEFALLF
jgi:hypothetical protein